MRARRRAETLYQFEKPFVSNASKCQRAFGPFEPTPREEAITHTLAWFSKREAPDRHK